MELNFSRWILEHWQRKLVAVLTAIVMWFVVNNSIIDTKTIPNIAIKVINLPADKAIVGLLPNGLLSRRITLTLTGTSDVIADLEASDIEVVLDASTVDTDEWVVDITKKNLVSLNPSINLSKHITQVEYSDFVIKLSRLVTLQIPLTILPPTGEPPPGYLFIDIWPQRLFQTLTGPEEQIAPLATKGLYYQLDLSQVTSADLEKAKLMGGAAHGSKNELSFFVPMNWKKVKVPLRDGLEEELNDPDSKYLHLTFLPIQWLPIDGKVPIRSYYPVSSASTINSQSHPLATGDKVIEEFGLTLLKMPLYVYEVSQLFLDHIKDNLEVDIMAATPEGRRTLLWSLNVIDAQELENRYVAAILHDEPAIYGAISGGRQREVMLRRRFRAYLQQLSLYQHPDQKLYLECTLEVDKIVVK